MFPPYLASRLSKQINEENEHPEDVVMHEAIMSSGPRRPRSSRKVAQVFNEFKGRRAALIKALTDEFESFFSECNPEKLNLCLYGQPDGQWKVDLPVIELPPKLPEPALGINFTRDGMQRDDWANVIAVHSDAWLLSTAFYTGTKSGFDKSDRKYLFEMVNDLPTIVETVKEFAKKKAKGASTSNQTVLNSIINKSLLNSNAGIMPKQMNFILVKDDDEDEDKTEQQEEEKQGKTLCKACGENYAKSESRISSDMCEISFHGNHLKISPARAVHIEQYKCSNCVTRAKPKNSLRFKDDDIGEEQEEEQHGEILCWRCGDKYSKSEYWISYDMCKLSFHGNHVEISPARAVHIKQ